MFSDAVLPDQITVRFSQVAAVPVRYVRIRIQSAILDVRNKYVY